MLAGVLAVGYDRRIHCVPNLAWAVELTTRRLADLLSRKDAIGVLSYYYLPGALFAVVLMGIAAYGPKSIIEWLSIPYAKSLATALSAMVSLFGLYQRAKRAA